MISLHCDFSIQVVVFLRGLHFAFLIHSNSYQATNSPTETGIKKKIFLESQETNRNKVCCLAWQPPCFVPSYGVRQRITVSMPTLLYLVWLL